MSNESDMQMHTNEQERDHRAGRYGRAMHNIRARAWMRDNPAVMKCLEDYAMHAWSAGAHVGIALLVERVRWLGVVERRDAEGYKINNSHRAEIARELMRRRTELAGFFETRESPGRSFALTTPQEGTP